MVSHKQIVFSQPRHPEVMGNSISSDRTYISANTVSIAPKSDDVLIEWTESSASLRIASQVAQNVPHVDLAAFPSTQVAAFPSTQVADMSATIVGKVLTRKTRKSSRRSGLGVSPYNPTASMTTSCDPAFCRSVLLHQALRRLGVNFASNHGGDKEFDLSEQASEIDDFISHDWRTGRWSKLCSMLIVYNGRLAIFVSNLVAISLCALQTDAVGLLPRDALVLKDHKVGPDITDITIGYWCLAVSGPIFLLFLCFGHNLAVLFSMGAGQRQVFVDKLCICQTDVDLKTKGIHALAGILKQSHRLVILWSPRYFKRLWCVYELASWVHHQTRHQQPKPIRFEPVAWGRITVGAWAVTYFASLLRMTHVYRDWLALLVFILFVTVVLYLRLFMQELMLLPDQVANFHVEASECFCCTAGHIHPQTGASIPCDRELIHETLITWASSQRTVSDNSDETPLSISHAASMHHFDSEVNLSLKQWAEKSVGIAPLPYEYALLALCPSTWYYADMMAGVLSESLTVEAYVIWFIWSASWAFLYLPVAMKLAMFFLSMLSRRCPATKLCCWCCNILLTAIVVVVAGIMFFALSYPMYLLMLQRSRLPYMLANCVWVLGTFVVFNMDRVLRTVQRYVSVPVE